MNINTQGSDSPGSPLGALVVGGGPAGFSLLLAARRSSSLEELLAANVRIIERNSVVGPGEIGNYCIRSDSLADNFLKSVEFEAAPSLRGPLQFPAGRRIDGQRGNAVKLHTVGTFLTDVATEMRQYLRNRHLDPFVTGLEAFRADVQQDGCWVTSCRDSDGRLVSYHSTALVLATGAHQPNSRLYGEEVAGVPLLPRFAHKTIQSSKFLGREAAKNIADLVGNRSLRIAIVGSSHSAIASAFLCLQDSIKRPCDCVRVSVLHRNALRLTYASVEAALSDGYHAFSAADVCPKTGRVFPLAGFRNDSRDFLRHQLQLGGLKADSRLQLLLLEPKSYDEANKILAGADLIVAALGYRPRALALFGRNGERLRLQSEIGVLPLVDRQSRVLSSTGRAIAGVFALGLAAGYPLAGEHGESTFKGQANGLALWQSDIGEQLIANVIDLIRSRQATARHAEGF